MLNNMHLLCAGRCQHDCFWISRNEERQSKRCNTLHAKCCWRGHSEDNDWEITPTLWHTARSHVTSYMKLHLSPCSNGTQETMTCPDAIFSFLPVSVCVLPKSCVKYRLPSTCTYMYILFVFRSLFVWQRGLSFITNHILGVCKFSSHIYWFQHGSVFVL